MGILDAIRTIAVSKGYIPDILQYLPNNEAGYEEAKTEIGDLIEVMGGGQYKSKKHKNENTIVVSFVYVMPSSIGAIGGYKNVPDGDRFKVVKNPDTLFDLYFQIVYITREERIITKCEQMIAETFGKSATLKAFNESGEITGEFTIERQEPFNVSFKDWYERGYRFRVENVDLVGQKEVGSVAKFTQFGLTIKTTKDTLLNSTVNFKSE
jgi:hypothetical protein